MELQEQLRSHGYRLTAQRQLVLEAVIHLGHATPEDVLTWVRARNAGERSAGQGSAGDRSAGINVSTVYRTLELLEKLGLVTHTHLDHGPPTYHAAEAAQHLHLVCRDCGAVIEVDQQLAAPLVEAVRTEAGFVADVSHLTVFGQCRRCAA